MSDQRNGKRVLLAGVTTRPLALSAVRAGYRVTAIDAFGDLDLRMVAKVILARPDRPGKAYGPLQAATAGLGIAAELAAYTSNFENYPAAVACLAAGRRLLGNSPATLARARDPLRLSRVLREHGFASPQCHAQPPREGVARAWLLKPRRSGGGHGIVPWLKGQSVPRTMYLQQRIPGAPGSISFAADGTNAIVLGFSRQLVGDRRFGAGSFRYCGNILAARGARLFSRQEELLKQAAALAQLLTRRFDLHGLNGLDFMAKNGLPYPIEVNPRYSASMELIERSLGISMFETHVRASMGQLPVPPVLGSALHGKAIVFARQDCAVGDTRSWLNTGWLADVPPPSSRIAQGRPICTVFAEAATYGACDRLLARRAAAVYRAVQSLGKNAA
jgi:predicted ATP-grasp superfamily ATP-dependent carboligase